MNPFWIGNPSALGQQTAAGQIIVSRSAGNGIRGTATRRKRKSTRKTAARTRSASPAKRASKRGRMVKGSAAAKAYMAKIRRKRR